MRVFKTEWLRTVENKIIAFISHRLSFQRFANPYIPLTSLAALQRVLTRRTRDLPLAKLQI